jgi:hypothetical protein
MKASTSSTLNSTQMPSSSLNSGSGPGFPFGPGGRIELTSVPAVDVSALFDPPGEKHGPMLKREQGK